MKVEKVRQLIDRLKRIPASEYDQRHWVFKEDCGTRACLGGHTCLMEGYRASDRLGEILGQDGKPVEEVSVEAGKILGISRGTANRLFDAAFTGWRHEKELEDAGTKEEEVQIAIRELEDLIRLGPYEHPYKTPREVEHAVERSRPRARGRARARAEGGGGERRAGSRRRIGASGA